MALTNIGLAGIMTFNAHPAISGMMQAAGASQRLAQSQGLLQNRTFGAVTAFNRLAMASTGMGFALAPATAAFTLGLKQAAEFERQMDAVAAVSRASAEDMAKLEAKAKLMGATTVFTATQSGEAMENLGRAGASVTEILDGISGVMSVAAADSIPLATAADIVAQVVRGMGLEFKEANRVADVLALTSASTNTDVRGLGQAFKYSAAQARSMGINLETTATLLGAAADAGLRGSIGGTSFTNMLIKLAKPSEKAQKWLKANNIELTTMADGGLDIVSVIQQIESRLSGMTNAVQKSAIITELFGIRGQRAYSALEASLRSGRLPELLERIANSQGAAQEMAEQRLSNFLGQIVLLKSALEGLALETTGRFLKPLTESTRSAARAIGQVVEVLQILNAGANESRQELEKRFGPTVVGVAYGIKSALDTVINTWYKLRNIAASVFGFMGSGSSEFTESVARLVTLFGIVAAALSPIFFGLAGIAVFGSTVLVPTFRILSRVVGRIGPAIGRLSIPLALLSGAFWAVRQDGETFGQTVVRIFTAASNAATKFWEGALVPIAETIWSVVQPSFEMLGARWNYITIEGRRLFRFWMGSMIRVAQFAMDNIVPIFASAFNSAGNFIRSFVNITLDLLSSIPYAVIGLFQMMMDVGLHVMEMFVKKWQFFANIWLEIAEFAGLTKGSAFWAEIANFVSQDFDVTSGKARLESMDIVGSLGLREPEDNRQLGDDTTYAKEISDIAAFQKAALAKDPKVEVDVNLEDQRKLDINNCVTIDGREVAMATSRHRQEIHERAGFRATPWQRRMIVEQGAVPVPVGGGS